MTASLVARRLAAHGFAGPRDTDPAALVASFGAMQAQDYAASLWAVGVRLIEAGVATVEAAISDGSLIRTHPLRNTLHLVAAADVRWLLGLTAARMLDRAARRYRELGLDAKTFARSETVIARALANHTHLDRRQLAAVLERAKIATTGQRFVHLVHHAELAGLVCSGVRRGKQLTFALLDERVPAAPAVPRDVALARLARVYFARRGPATLADFTWWSGLAVAEARAAVGSLGKALAVETIAGVAHYGGAAIAPGGARAHLLPAFDEYAVAYRDRTAIATGPLTGFQLLGPIAVLDGRVVATWKRTTTRTGVTLALAPLRPLAARDRGALEAAAARHAAFLGLAPKIAITASR